MAAVAEIESPAVDEEQGTPAHVFRYAEYVHVGEGAATCEHREDGKCADLEHFHAYCRLPNQFQHAAIREKALAAKARRIRAMRDPDSDASAILEADMDALLRADDRQALVDELANRDWWKRQLEAGADVQEDERFEHIERDRERLAEIERMALDERPQDERDELVRHLAAFGEAVEAKRVELERPLRESLEARDVAELVDLVREDRVQNEASQAFMDTYSRWQVFRGTLKPAAKPHEQVFDDVLDLERADPPVVVALRDTFANLETGLNRPPS